ncbi:hypothetical protein RRG08_028312 [Elysia crispata]|uniref:Uncharacterized protein n=1 Tax=Elysia crispata TaxID=231223 RepID=A0AAE1AXF0_9GAST|nr:hypothetical protein RRG08_028312 [Elysia crispata]
MCVKTNLALVDTITLFRFEPRGAGRAVNKAMMLQSDTRAGQDKRELALVSTSARYRNQGPINRFCQPENIEINQENNTDSLPELVHIHQDVTVFTPWIRDLGRGEM